MMFGDVQRRSKNDHLAVRYSNTFYSKLLKFLILLKDLCTMKLLVALFMLSVLFIAVLTFFKLLRKKLVQTGFVFFFSKKILHKK
jgi:hypothetical protein